MTKDIVFSAYKNALSKDPIETSFLTETQAIRDGDYKQETETAQAIKNIDGKDDYDKYRLNIWCFTAGVNTIRIGKADPLPEEITGLCVLDIDDESQDPEKNKAILKEYPWVLAVSRSIGGNGLFAIIKCDKNNLQACYEQAAAILSNRGVIVAKGQHNPNRIRYCSYDPDIYFLEDPAAAPSVTIQIHNNDREEIFQSIVKIKSKGLDHWPVGERHHYLVQVISWANVIGISESYCLEMAEKHCRPLMANGNGYDIETQVKDIYKRYKNEYDSKEWIEKEEHFESNSSPEFIPDWNNRPPYIPPVLKLGDTSILTYQNISTITAAPGSGKTSCVEAIGASFLNPNADSLGFHVEPSCKGVLIIDTERTKSDVWNSFNRMCRRAGKREGDQIDGVRIVGMRGISDPEQRKKIILNHLESKSFDLLLLDGIGDILRDTNNIEQSKAALDWLRWITDQYGVSIIVTIHPNPGGDKARGNAGGELLRDSETVLIIKEFEGAKILTSDFSHGKNRNTAKITTGFKWSDEHMMFISVDHEQLAINKKSAISEAKKEQVQKIAKKLLPPPNSMKCKDLVTAVKKEYAIRDRAAMTRIRDWSDWGIITHNDEFYRLNV